MEFASNPTVKDEDVPHDAKEMPRMVDMCRGEKVPLIFTENEMMQRVTKLRQRMEENGIGAAVLTSVHNINYFSGFLYSSFGRLFGLVVTPEKCINVSPAVDGIQPWRRSFTNTKTYTDWQKGNFFHAILNTLGTVEGKVGLEFDTISLETFKMFQEILPKNPLVDIANLTMHIRLIKSAEEIEVIRQGSRIAELGVAAVVDAMYEGVHEYEVALKATEVMVKEIAKTYPNSELKDTWAWVQSGINTDGAHNPVTSKQIKKGDILSVNCFPMISGYYNALERTFFFGQPDAEHLRVWNINCQVHRRGIELVRPGARCCDITAKLNEIYKEHDLLKYRISGHGHSMGVMSHYYGRDAGLELREDVTTVLQPGMVLTMEPFITIPQGCPGAGTYREHDILIVKEDGAENITKFPFGPEHNIIRK